MRQTHGRTTLPVVWRRSGGGLMSLGQVREADSE